MDDISSTLYALEPVKEVEPDSGLDGGPLSDRTSSMGMRCKNSLISLEMGKGKVMIMQSRRRILLALIVLVENLTMVVSARIIKVRHTVSRVLDQVKSSLSIQTK